MENDGNFGFLNKPGLFKGKPVVSPEKESGAEGLFTTLVNENNFPKKDPNGSSKYAPRKIGSMKWDIKARGEPFQWLLGGALVFGMVMITGFLALIAYNGLMTFYPDPIEKVTLKDGTVLAGEPTRSEWYKPQPESIAKIPPSFQRELSQKNGLLQRTLYKTGNFDLYNYDYKWVDDYNAESREHPKDLFMFERIEWGPFIGKIVSADFDGQIFDQNKLPIQKLYSEHEEAENRRKKIKDLEKNDIAHLNSRLENGRLMVKKAELRSGEGSPEHVSAQKEFKELSEKLQRDYDDLAKEAQSIKEKDSKCTITLSDIGGREKKLPISDLVRFYPANDINLVEKLRIYLSRWSEFLTQEPREANTEGGVMPAIFGTFCMTILMALAVSPFGVMAALYLREYAKQGRLVSLVRICVNNLAGVPSIVYGVFGLGFSLLISLAEGLTLYFSLSVCRVPLMVLEGFYGLRSH